MNADLKYLRKLDVSWVESKSTRYTIASYVGRRQFLFTPKYF